MTAYIVVETDIRDPEQYELYKQASPAAVAAGGGRFIARGGELAVLEGDWRPKRLTLLSSRISRRRSGSTTRPSTGKRSDCARARRVSTWSR